MIYLIRWVIQPLFTGKLLAFSPEFICVIVAFEDCLDQNEILADSTTNHNEDSQAFCQRFSSDVNRLITVKQFMPDHLTKFKSMNDDLKAIGEKQVETFTSDWLVGSKLPISQKFILNKMKIWNSTDSGQVKCKVEFSPFRSAVKKVNLVCKHRKTMKNCLNMKLTISLKPCTKMASNYIRAQNLKLLDSLIHQLLCYHTTKK